MPPPSCAGVHRPSGPRRGRPHAPRIGSGIAGDDGTVTLSVVTPGDAPLGEHTLRLEGIGDEIELATVGTKVTVERSRPVGFSVLAVLLVAAAATATAAPP